MFCLLASNATSLDLAPLTLRPANSVASTSASIHRRWFLAGAASSVALAPHSLSAAEPEIFTPPAGSLSGVTILVTGSNTGLGLESAKRLASAGANLIVTARSLAKVDYAVREVAAVAAPEAKVIGAELDLASLSSVKSLLLRLRAVMGSDAAIDVLLNNAGVMAIPERLETSEGFERTIGVNHLGHYALVAALIPLLERARKGFRIVNVSSEAHRWPSANDIQMALNMDLDPQYSAWGNYGLSKAANVLFSVELQRRMNAAGVAGSVVALHPGTVQTDLSRYLLGGVAAGDTRLSETTPRPSGLSESPRGVDPSITAHLCLPSCR